MQHLRPGVWIYFGKQEKKRKAEEQKKEEEMKALFKPIAGAQKVW